jgi:hypothetical protein
MSALAVAPVHVLRVELADALHEPRATLLFFRRHKQMNMVGHQTVGVQQASRARQDLAQVKKIKGPVLVIEEAVRAVVAALNDVDGDTRKHDACASRHAGVNGPAAGPLTEENVVCP